MNPTQLKRADISVVKKCVLYSDKKVFFVKTLLYQLQNFAKSLSTFCLPRKVLMSLKQVQMHTGR